jgi:hypothetical protein
VNRRFPRRPRSPVRSLAPIRSFVWIDEKFQITRDVAPALSWVFHAHSPDVVSLPGHAMLLSREHSGNCSLVRNFLSAPIRSFVWIGEKFQITSGVVPALSLVFHTHSPDVFFIAWSFYAA